VSIPGPELPRVSPSGLAALLGERFTASGASGARVELESREEIVEHAGIDFIVRVLADHIAKAAARAKDEASTNTPRDASPPSRSPFLAPYEPDLLIGRIGDRHVALLNKYNLVERHLLIVTREYEKQESPLTAADLEAARFCLDAIEGLVFYNAGTAAGASQTHKHLQLVPFPLGPRNLRFPFEPAIAEALGAGLDTVQRLGYLHRVVPLTAGSGGDHAVYRELLRIPGVQADGADPAPHNLLMTREWMMMIPRSRASEGPLDVNALGFAGTLVARCDRDLEWLRAIGPLELLRRVGVSRS
jgi:ATP adenylyltransferase